MAKTPVAVEEDYVQKLLHHIRHPGNARPKQAVNGRHVTSFQPP